MKVIFFDDNQRVIKLFENNLASDYFYCVSRAIAVPEMISANIFVKELESHPSIKQFLSQQYGLRSTLLGLHGRSLIDFICSGVGIPGISSYRLFETQEEYLCYKRLLSFKYRERVFSRGASLDEDQKHSKKHLRNNQ